MQQPATITVTFPATPDYLRLARIATADVGSRAGFDYEEIDDLRIAVSELCSMISGTGDTSGATAATLTLDFAFEPGAVTVEGSASPGALSETELSQAIVRAVVDHVELVAHDGCASFRASKRARAR